MGGIWGRSDTVAVHMNHHAAGVALEEEVAVYLLLLVADVAPAVDITRELEPRRAKGSRGTVMGG